MTIINVHARYHRVKRKAEKRAAEKKAEEDPQADNEKETVEKAEKLRAEVIIFLLLQYINSPNQLTFNMSIQF